MGSPGLLWPLCGDSLKYSKKLHFGISLSSSGTLRAVDKLGKGHNEEVLNYNWVNCLQPLVSTTQVNATIFK